MDNVYKYYDVEASEAFQDINTEYSLILCLKISVTKLWVSSYGVAITVLLSKENAVWNWNPYIKEIAAPYGRIFALKYYYRNNLACINTSEKKYCSGAVEKDYGKNWTLEIALQISYTRND